MSGRSKNKTTLKDISLATGFTVNTVSHALNDKPDISEGTKLLIRRKADELGYVRNTVASSMRTGYTKTLAVIMSDISNPFFGIMVKLIENYARKYDYNTIIINTDEDATLEMYAINSALEKKVDGIILCPSQKTHEPIDFLKNSGCPFVLLGRHFSDPDVDFVSSDDVTGAFLATEYFIGQGCRRILHLGGPSYISSSTERLAGYKQALRKHGIPYSGKLVRRVPVTGGRCTSVFKKLSQEKISYDAILAFSDLVALEVLAILQKTGQEANVPIIGYDNILSNMQLPYPLSSIGYDKSELAEQLVSILLHKIRNDTAPKTMQIFLPTHLVLR